MYPFFNHLVLHRSLLIFTCADLYCILNMLKNNLEQMKYTINKISVFIFWIYLDVALFILPKYFSLPSFTSNSYVLDLVAVCFNMQNIRLSDLNYL